MNDHDSTVRDGVDAPRPMAPIPVPLPLVSPPPVEADPPRTRPRRSRRKVLLIAFTLATLAAAVAFVRCGKEPSDPAPSSMPGDVVSAVDVESPAMSRDTTAHDPEPPALVSKPDEAAPQAAEIELPAPKPKPKISAKRPRCTVFGTELCPKR